MGEAVKERIKKIPGAIKLVRGCRAAVKGTLPLSLYRICRFYQTFGFLPNIFNPRTFNEKVLYKSLYDRRDIITLFADKVSSRDYVQRRLGSDEHLTKLYGVYSSALDINSDSLPAEFVLKANHGCGWTKLYLKDAPRHIDQVRSLASSWLAENFYDRSKEWCYKNISPLIFVEELLRDGGRIPIDYKFYCCNGKAEFVQVHIDRFSDHRINLYDLKWRQIGGLYGYRTSATPVEAPSNFDAMHRIAETLSAETDFVRVDLYNIRGRIYFGEFTNYPGDGLERFVPSELDLEFGSLWKVPKKY